MGQQFLVKAVGHQFLVQWRGRGGVGEQFLVQEEGQVNSLVQGEVTPTLNVNRLIRASENITFPRPYVVIKMNVNFQTLPSQFGSKKQSK